MASIVSAGTTSGTSLNLSGDTSGVLQLASNGSTTAVTIDTSQNVGIGTSSNSYTAAGRGNLNIAGSSSAILGFQISSVAKGYIFHNGTDLQMWNEVAGANVFGTNGLERMRIDSSGNLLINTTSVSDQGKATIAFSGATNQGLNLRETAGTSSAGFMYFNHNSTVLGTITRNAGTNAVLYNTTSDVRLKENIADANPALETVLNIKVRKYDWIGADYHQEYGFVAQELAEVVSDVVTKGRTEEDTWAVDYGKLTPILCKAIQELKAELDATKAEVQALKGTL